jgi:ferredoxin--NADP+ reductase
VLESHLILEKRQFSADVFLLRLRAPLIARERKPGQFIILSGDVDYGERIPLTIADANADEGWITLIFQRVGRGTRQLAEMNVGDEIPVLVGPLGTPTHIAKLGTVVGVGGGIGAAPLYPILEALKAAGNRVVTILGARTRELLILEERFRAISDELILCTDDGSAGRKALVTEPLKELCAATPKPDLAVAIGPAIMMKFCCATTRPFGVHTVVSLNPIMVDGTGMCGGCRVTVGGKVKFVCVDGPEFDGHAVDFEELMQRQGSYKPQEKRQLDAHLCKLDAAFDKAVHS